MRAKLLSSIAVLVVLGSLTATGQTTAIRGFVTDARSEEPLQSANVVLVADGGEMRGTVTDGDGFFRFGGVPAGEYRLQVRYIGFLPHDETIEITAGRPLTVSVALAESQGELEEVVIEADAESGIGAVTAGLEAIRPMDIARVPVPGAAGDLAAYIQSVPGVVLPGDRGGRYYIRGGSDDQNLVLLEGVPVYGAFHILSLYSAFPDDLIERASLYTGGFGAEHGGRLSSVIDVEARDGNKQALGGSIALAPFLSGARIEGPIIPGRVSILLSGRRSLVADLTPDLFGQKMPFRFGDAFGKIHALLGAGQSLSLFGLVTDDSGQIAGSQYSFQGDPVARAATDSLDLGWENRVLGGRYVMEPGLLPFRVELTGGTSRYTSSFGPVDSPERRAGIESLDLGGEISWELQNVELGLGVSHRSTDLTYDLDEPFRNVPSTSSETLSEQAAWFTATWSAPHLGLAISPGVRVYSAGDRAPTQALPRARMSWTPRFLGGAHRFNVAWGEYRQAVVGLNDERDVGNPFSIWTASPPDVSLPTSRHLIVGWNGSLVRGIQIAVEGYRKSYDGLLVPVFSALPTFTTGLQAADGWARGIDVRVALDSQPFVGESRLGGWISYAYGEVEYETRLGVVYPPSHDRRHAVQAVLAAERGEIAISMQAQFGSGLPFTPSAGFDVFHLLTPDVDVASDPGSQRILYGDPNSARQPMYARMDLWLERRVDRGKTVATIRAGAMNIFNRSNLFYFDLFTFRRVDQLPLLPSVGLKVEFR